MALQQQAKATVRKFDDKMRGENENDKLHGEVRDGDSMRGDRRMKMMGNCIGQKRVTSCWLKKKMKCRRVKKNKRQN